MNDVEFDSESHWRLQNHSCRLLVVEPVLIRRCISRFDCFLWLSYFNSFDNWIDFVIKQFAVFEISEFQAFPENFFFDKFQNFKF